MNSVPWSFGLFDYSSIRCDFGIVRAFRIFFLFVFFRVSSWFQSSAPKNWNHEFTRRNTNRMKYHEENHEIKNSVVKITRYSLHGLRGCVGFAIGFWSFRARGFLEIELDSVEDAVDELRGFEG